MTLNCACGEPVTTTLHVHYSYPRTTCVPEAANPWHVHGGGYHIATCGAPGCEAEAFNAVREEILVSLARLDCSLMQMACLELTVYEPGDMSAFGIAGDEDGP